MSFRDDTDSARRCEYRLVDTNNIHLIGGKPGIEPASGNQITDDTRGAHLIADANIGVCAAEARDGARDDAVPERRKTGDANDAVAKLTDVDVTFASFLGCSLIRIALTNAAATAVADCAKRLFLTCINKRDAGVGDPAPLCANNFY